MADRRIQQQFEIAVAPGKLFRALTQPLGLTSWMLESATLTLRAGTTYWFTWSGGYALEGRVLEVRAGRAFALTWPQGTPRKPLGETRVRFTVRPKGKGSILTMVHSGFGTGATWVQAYALSASGWAYYLMNLKSVLETGHDLRRDGDRF